MELRSEPKMSVEEPTVRAIYDSEFGYVFQTLGRLGVRGHEREDLVQEVFLRAFRNFAAYDRSRPLRPWLFGIALRVASDFRRLRRHGTEVGGQETDAVDESDPERSLHEGQQRQLVWRALDQLRLDQRAIIILSDIDGVPMREIAEVLEVPLATGYSRLRLARTSFAEAVRSLRGGEVHP